MNRPRVLVADDHPAIVDGYREILLSECDLVESVSDGQSLLAAGEGCKPDIILLDISMPSLNGVAACRQVRKALPSVKIIVASMHSDMAFVIAAVQAGARGYVLKQLAASDLLKAIRAVLEGKMYLSSSLRTQLWDQNDTQRKPMAALTDRQRQLVTLVGEGRSTKEIASLMEISFPTVVNSRARAMRRLHIDRPFDLLRYAIHCGLKYT